MADHNRVSIWKQASARNGSIDMTAPDQLIRMIRSRPDIGIRVLLVALLVIAAGSASAQNGTCIPAGEELIFPAGATLTEGPSVMVPGNTYTLKVVGGYTVPNPGLGEQCTTSVFASLTSSQGTPSIVEVQVGPTSTITVSTSSDTTAGTFYLTAALGSPNEYGLFGWRIPVQQPTPPGLPSPPGQNCPTPSITSVKPSDWPAGRTTPVTLWGTGFVCQGTPQVNNMTVTPSQQGSTVQVSSMNIIGPDEITFTATPDSDDPTQPATIDLYGNPVVVLVAKGPAATTNKEQIHKDVPPVSNAVGGDEESQPISGLTLNEIGAGPSGTPVATGQATIVGTPTPTISGDGHDVWYFGPGVSSQSSGATQFPYKISLAAHGVGTATWNVVTGNSEITITPSGAATTVSSSGAAFSKTELDVSVTVTMSGKTSAPYKITTHEPFRMIPSGHDHRCDGVYALYGYLDVLHYKVQDQLGSDMSLYYFDFNEHFTSSFVNDGGSNWLAVEEGPGTDSEVHDSISGVGIRSIPAPKPMPVCKGNDVQTQHTTQEWRIGSRSSGAGVKLQSDQWTRYADKANHVHIVPVN